MKQLGNLALICARRSGILLQILDGKAAVHVGSGPDRRAFTADWDDNEQINTLIYELNYGELSEKEVNHDSNR